MGMPRTVPTLIATLAILGCSTAPHVGSWAHQDSDVYLGLEFKGNGECLLVGVARVPLGEGRSGSTGGGYKCMYSVDGRTLTVSEAVLDSGQREPLKDPVVAQLAPDDASLRVVSDGKVLTLH